MRLIGFIVNPIAGMGGTVGLKGTDGDLSKKAIEMGAKSTTPKLIDQFLSSIENKKEIYFIAAPDIMGESYIKNRGFNYKVIGQIGKETFPEDTKKIAKLLYDKKIEILVFFGGDGTARDIYDSVGLKLPVIAVPTGVKMFSSVFAVNSRAASQLVDAIILNNITYEEREVLDINETSYSKGILESKLYGYLRVPKVLNLIQASKDTSRIGSSYDFEKKEIALHVIENMENDILYLLGPGTTVKAITDELGLPKTLLGIDAIYRKEIIEKDLNEQGILGLLNTYSHAQIIVTPIGGQGFIFGRGNKQFTPKILENIGKKNVIIIAAKEKLKSLKCLRIDSTSIDIDNIFKGLTNVIIGYKEETVIQIE
ncbi:MAG: ATP-NAD kinase family protein [Candidatus Lokiarchaeota archaeon]|nr:ATP-NAD kinase family protein [Candidatus Lokiarchaeota archaeon]